MNTLRTKRSPNPTPAKSRLIEAVRKIKEMKISLLIAESNLANASRVADRLYAIDRGEIIYQGDPRKVVENQEVMSTIRG